MFKWNDKDGEKMKNWLACFIVVANIEFQPSCNLLIPFFKKKWNANLENVDTPQNAQHLMEEIWKKTILENV